MKQYNEKDFTINDKYTIKCWTEDTRSGFRHLAELTEDDTTIETAKRSYTNRTWEAYDYQSVVHDLINKSDIDNKQAVKDKFDSKAKEAVNIKLKSLGAVMKMGGLLSEDDKQNNEFRVRMLKAQFGEAIILPEDWDELDEETKTKRLDKIEQFLTERE